MTTEELLAKLEAVNLETLSEAKKRLVAALIKTAKVPFRDSNYLDITLNQRLAGITGAGSWFESMTEEELLDKLISPHYEITEFIPEDAYAGSTYFKISIPGKNGITMIKDLPENSPLFLTVTHAGTGKLSVATNAKVSAKDEEETTLILGEEEGIGEMLFTLHPGLPAAFSDLTLSLLKEKQPLLAKTIESKSQELASQGKDPNSVVLQISPTQAQILGFDMAKLTSEEYGNSLEENAVDVTNISFTEMAQNTVDIDI